MVGVKILSNGNSGLSDVTVLCQVSIFILEVAKPSLKHDVICPEAFGIHTLPDSVTLYTVNVVLTGKRVSLI